MIDRQIAAKYCPDALSPADRAIAAVRAPADGGGRPTARRAVPMLREHAMRARRMFRSVMLATSLAAFTVLTVISTVAACTNGSGFP
jgi:hypothetical protein